MVKGIEFDVLNNIDQKYYCSNYYDFSVNKYGVKCGIIIKTINILGK